MDGWPLATYQLTISLSREFSSRWAVVKIGFHIWMTAGVETDSCQGRPPQQITCRKFTRLCVQVDQIPSDPVMALCCWLLQVDWFRKKTRRIIITAFHHVWTVEYTFVVMSSVPLLTREWFVGGCLLVLAIAALRIGDRLGGALAKMSTELQLLSRQWH